MSIDRVGIIQNRQNAKQLILYEGLTYGRISPTDIDAFIDFNNEIFVFIEVKRTGAEMPRGQRLALERLCNSSLESGRHAIVIVAHHDTDGDIYLASLPVVTIYTARKRWRYPKFPLTVKQAVDFYRTRPLSVERA